MYHCRLMSQLKHSLIFATGQREKLDIFDFIDSWISRPKPFKIDFKPRSERIAPMVLEEATKARKAVRICDGGTRVTMESAQP